METEKGSHASLASGWTKTWEKVLENVQQQIGTERFNLWFRFTHLSSLNDNSITISVPNMFIQSRLQESFLPILKEGITSLTKKELKINFSISPNTFHLKGEKPTETKPPIPSNRTESNFMTNKVLPGKKLKLEDFVVGPCNRLAYAAALEVVKQGDPTLNPLFIHGPVGVGKTHLLQGILNSLKGDPQGYNAVYMPAERWTNEFIYSLKNGKMAPFRERYRNVDVLLIDDVDFFSNKPGTQEEFLHTFNALYQLSKRMIFTSDAHPKHINRLKESLSSRFVSGMVSRIERPDFNTMMTILRIKISRLKKAFPEDVLAYVAEISKGNVREAESALITVSAFADVNKKELNIQTARDALSMFSINRNNKNITINEIEEAVIKHFNISRPELFSKKKTKAISLARQLSMYLTRKNTNFSYQQIGSHFGNKSHASVIFAIKKIEERLRNDHQFKPIIEQIKEKITSQNIHL
jgi:chromosomal replication initiator protein